jgi:transcriptional regulator with XRE-family HTH domain
MAEFNVGERLRQLRADRGMSQRRLAEAADVPHGQISMIETNRSSPSIASMRKILGGLGLTMSAFFEPESANSSQVFYNPSDLVDLTSSLYGVEGVQKIALKQVGDARAHGLQILHERYEPGADTGEMMLRHAANEGGVVISGEVEVTVGDEVKVLTKGCAYLFDSRAPHRFRNISNQPAEIVSGCTPPYL